MKLPAGTPESIRKLAPVVERVLADPRLSVPMAIGSGAVKGAVVGVAIGKLATAVVLGVCGGAVFGTAVSWVARRGRAASGADSTAGTGPSSGRPDGDARDGSLSPPSTTPKRFPD